jgi:hypothetical protein
LEHLDIADNAYTSGIPASITNLPSLEFFYLDYCFLDDDLSFMIGMPKIFELRMDGTVVDATIPTEIGTLKTLSSFSITSCGLKGTIPTEIGLLTSLDRLWLNQNSLTGTIPTEIGNLSRTAYLNFGGNLLTGSMPQEICNNLIPSGLLATLGSDCDTAECTCCGDACGNFA